MKWKLGDPVISVQDMIDFLSSQFYADFYIDIPILKITDLLEENKQYLQNKLDMK